MKSFKRQGGLSMTGWLFVVCVFGFSLFTAARLAPHYLDNRFVVASLEDLAEDPAFPTMTLSEVKEKLSKNFKINNVRGKPLKSLKVERKSKATVVSIFYEEKIPFFYNVEVLLTFHSVLNSKHPEDCCKPDPEQN